MHRILKSLLCLLLLCCITGCGSSDNKGTELVLGSTNTIENYAEFSLFKIETKKDIKAPLHTGGLYYNNEKDGEVFVDVVLDWTNLTSNAIENNELFVLTAKSDNGIEYTNPLYVVETDGGTSVNQYEAIDPLVTSRIHCALSVPESETTLTLKLNVKNEVFMYQYTLNDDVNNAKLISDNEVIDDQDYATLTFKGIEYTDDLLPSDTSRTYNHYKVKNSDNVYFVAKFDLTNNSGSSLTSDEIVGINITYMDKYHYDGFVVVEDEDGRGFDAYEDISPLSTRHFYYLIEVPKELKEESYKLDIYFNKQEFIYQN